MSPPAGRLTVGLVRGLHGLRGAVRVEILSDDPTRFSVGASVFAEGDDRALTIAWVQLSKPGVLLRFDQVTTREEAERLRARYLETEVREPLPQGHWYWHEIEGLEVLSTTGESVGKVTEVVRVGEAEVYVVRGGPRGEVLVPGVAAMVPELEPAAGRMTIDLAALGLPLEPPPPLRSRPPRPPRQVRQTRRMRQKASRASADSQAASTATMSVRPGDPPGPGAAVARPAGHRADDVGAAEDTPA